MIYTIIYVAIGLICIGALYSIDPFDTEEGERTAISIVFGIAWPVTLAATFIAGILCLPIWVAKKLSRR